MSDICTVCGLPKELCICSQLETEQAKVTISVVKRRYGKDVTIISGLEKHPDVKSIGKKLKTLFATGGTVKEGSIELQGDLRKRAKEELEKLGFTNVEIKNTIKTKKR